MNSYSIGGFLINRSSNLYCVQSMLIQFCRISFRLPLKPLMSMVKMLVYTIFWDWVRKNSKCCKNLSRRIKHHQSRKEIRKLKIF